MSGGSLNYIFCAEIDQLFNADRVADLETAEATLLSAGYKDIAMDVRRLIEYIKSAEIRVMVLHEQLSNVLHAVEWYISADYSKTTMRKYLEDYRAGRPAEED